MKIQSIILSAFAALLLSSCAVTLPGTATNNPMGSKRGSSNTVALFSGLGKRAASYAPTGASAEYLPTMYIGIPLNSDFGIIEACKNGKITKISTVDVKIYNYILISKVEYIVTGE